MMGHMQAPMRPTEPDGPSQAPRRGKRTTQDMIAENKGPGFAVVALRTLAGLAVALVIFAGIFFIAAAIEGDDPSPLAPWNDTSAPSAAPASLDDQ